jgi:hypothetical protein
LHKALYKYLFRLELVAGHVISEGKDPMAVTVIDIALPVLDGTFLRLHGGDTSGSFFKQSTYVSSQEHPSQPIVESGNPYYLRNQEPTIILNDSKIDI